MLHVNSIITLVLMVYLLLCGVAVKIASPSFVGISGSAVLCLPIGLLLSFLFRKNCTTRYEATSKLNLEPGFHGLRELLHQMPSWCPVQEKEKVAWLNKVLSKSWPYYDKAICNEIRLQVEPLLESYKPPFIAKIGFKKLTFGESPFAIDSIWTDREQDDRVVMEVAFRWRGDANIQLFIQLHGLSQLAGEATSMVVKFTKLQLSGCLRVVLYPLVDQVPGFGAITAALTQSPIIKYNLDFGAALGSSFSASLVRRWLDPFIRNTLVELLVWPERIISPVLPESVTGSLEHLKKRLQGILRVTVVKAWEIRQMDLGWRGHGTADPFVSMWTNPQRKIETKIVRNTLTPEWGETCFMLIQEPTTQVVKVEVYDWDAISLKELGSGFNVIKNIRNMYGARELIGRCIIPVKEFSRAPGEAFEETFDLGLQDWASLGGPGKGAGKVAMEFFYSPISECRGLRFKTGVVIVKVLKCSGLTELDFTGDMYLFVKLKLRNARQKAETRTAVMSAPRKGAKTGQRHGVDPSWDRSFNFYDISKSDILEVKVSSAAARRLPTLLRCLG